METLQVLAGEVTVYGIRSGSRSAETAGFDSNQH